MRDRNEGVRWREMVEWDSGGMRDLYRPFFPREIRERVKYTGMRQTWEIQDARELATSRSLKIMAIRPITSAALSAGGGEYLFYILMQPNLGLKHTLCVAEHITFDTSPT